MEETQCPGGLLVPWPEVANGRLADARPTFFRFCLVGFPLKNHIQKGCFFVCQGHRAAGRQRQESQNWALNSTISYFRERKLKGIDIYHLSASSWHPLVLGALFVVRFLQSPQNLMCDL